MGFISFNEGYYLQKLEKYENSRLTGADIYEARQLLKVLDDLTDEGYTTLNDRLEADASCLTRLRTVIRENGAVPFAVDHERLRDTSYSGEEYELNALVDALIREADAHGEASGNLFLSEIRRYSEWIGYEEGTAYVFLLRDALLPYVYYAARGRKALYPWLISRHFLEDITGTAYVDDDIRLPLYEALEEGYGGPEDFFATCGERILRVLDGLPCLKEALLALLASVRQEKIIVVESGYMGTIPMMLKALDDRVDFRLFTTAPFLYQTYRDKIFCRRYEDIRKFETLYSQGRLLRYASFKDGRFYVNVSEDSAVRDRSLAEIKRFGKN